MIRPPVVRLVVICAVLLAPWRAAASSEHVDLPLRGKTIALAIYRPAGTAPARGTIIMGSGDVGWVGLAVSMCEYLRDNGYIAVGVNVRQYLSAFTSGQSHLMPDQVPGDYDAVADYLRGRGLLQPPAIVSGVSEGAALAVLAASSPGNHQWLHGVVTMGLPASAELAWRWSDFTSWITKKDAAEPSFAPRDFIASVSPLPLVMLQSTRDEYVTEADYRNLEQAAGAPSKLVLIDASNHRFTDRIPQLRREFMAALDWIRSQAG